MSTNEFETTEARPSEPRKGHAGIFAAVVAVLLVALGGNWYLFNRSNDLNAQLTAMRDDTKAQVSKLGNATNTLLEQRLGTINDDLKNANDSTTAALRQARAEVKKQTAQLNQQLEDAQHQVAGEVSELKDATNTANSKITEVSSDVSDVKTDVTGVKTNVASTQAELEKTGTDLKRVMGDMGVMSGLIATNSTDLKALRELGDRNYFEFKLAKGELTKKVDNVTLTLKKSDPKRNRYTMEVLADDKRLEKKDKTINEPVQLYLAGDRQPYEIVVNEVGKDEVAGYLATPKVKTARR
jgi:predicted  nucleic acid-binding Zn-ribbon protein